MTDELSLRIADAKRAVMAASSEDMPDVFREHAARLLTPPQDLWQRTRIVNALQDLRDDLHPKLSHGQVRQVVREFPHTKPTRNGNGKQGSTRAEDAAGGQVPECTQSQPHIVEHKIQVVPTEDGLLLPGSPEDEEEGEDEHLFRPPSLSQECEQVIDGLAESAGGLLGEFIQYVVNCARYPNRTLALGAALPLVGTLIGRRVATPTRSATHLFVVCLASTGAGKQHPLNCAMRAMKAAGAGCHIGPSSFMSQSAVVNHLQGMPLSLCPMDEFGSFLKKVNSPRASTHERAVSAVLRPAWGTSFEIMMTPEWAGRKAERISTPALSILGMSTPREYYDSLKSSDIENGLTNRLLVLSINELPDEATPKFDIDQLPESLVTGLAQLFNWDQTKMGTARLLDPNLEPKPEMLTWGDGAEDFYRGFSRAARDRIRADDQYGDIHAREAEIAIRLATIRAAGFRRDRGRAVVELDDMQWGAELAFHSGEIASIGAHQHMAENEQQAHKKLLLRLIPEHCEIKRNALCRKSQELSHREREAALSDLAEAGVIDVFRSTPSAGGRPAFSYRRRARSFVK